MKQWATLMDGIDRLQLEDVPEPTNIGADEVLVKIVSVSLNHRDVKIIDGDFKSRYDAPSKPVVVASDASGVVVRTGGSPAAEQWREGDRVFALVRPTHLTGPTRASHHANGIGLPQPGVLAEYRVFKATGLLAIPDYMTFDEASTLPIVGTTAWMALNWDRPIGQPRKDDATVLLLGTGGVSITALQQAKALGLTSIITSSSDAKLQRAKALGAQHLINYKLTPDWANEVLKITGGRGADVVVETGGPGTMDQSLRAVAEGGTISAVGVLTGITDDKSKMAANLSLINRNAALKGINIGPRDRTEEMLSLYASKEIRPVVDRTFGFVEAKEALNYVKEGSHFGKVVIKVA